jgi:hypothetical protein
VRTVLVETRGLASEPVKTPVLTYEELALLAVGRVGLEP